MSLGERIRLALRRGGASGADQLALARDENPQVRTYLAANPQVCPAAQRVLARDPLSRVRTKFAENKAFVPDDGFSLAFTRVHWPSFLHECVAAGLDKETVLDGWDGAVSEFLEAAKELGPGVEPGRADADMEGA